MIKLEFSVWFSYLLFLNHSAEWNFDGRFTAHHSNRLTFYRRMASNPKNAPQFLPSLHAHSFGSIHFIRRMFRFNLICMFVCLMAVCMWVYVSACVCACCCSAAWIAFASESCFIILINFIFLLWFSVLTCWMCSLLLLLDVLLFINIVGVELFLSIQQKPKLPCGGMLGILS